jgi:hypothetical protein
MVFLPHMREEELPQAVVPVEADQQLAVSHRDVPRHEEASFDYIITVYQEVII